MSKRRKDPTILFEEWAEDFTQKLTKDTYDLVDQASAEFGVEASKHIHVKFISYLIGNYLIGVLKELPVNRSKKSEILTFVQNNFRTAKMEIQEAVAYAFSEAMYSFTDKYVDYYCKVTAVDNNDSKALN